MDTMDSGTSKGRAGAEEELAKLRRWRLSPICFSAQRAFDRPYATAQGPGRHPERGARETAERCGAVRDGRPGSELPPAD